MANRYVGPGGNDGNSGLTWALRKLTLNGVEDTPVVANDVVYVGPGVYREMLTVDVSGNAGNPITYIADVTGENTDGVGGIVRITGSDNDQTTTRARCITVAGVARDYRTFRGFYLDMPTTSVFLVDAGSNNFIIEDCVFACFTRGIHYAGPDLVNNTVRRCIFICSGYYQSQIYFYNDPFHNTTGIVIENCISLLAHGGYFVYSSRTGGITVKNCAVYGGGNAVVIGAALGGGGSITVNNCNFRGIATALSAINLGEIVENYNTFFLNNANRANVNIGANSQTYPAILNPPILFDGMRFPWWIGELSEWSQVARITGTGTPSDDLFGISRPATASKLSWGPLQYRLPERDTGTTRGGSAASIKLDDAGEVPIFVPVDGSEITISVYVYREANYAGNLPQMIIKQPGAADQITTDVGAVSTWNQLTDTFTPNAEPPYVQVFFRSRNTAVAGNYDTFFDDMDVT